jgi:hypothetical protein
MPRVGFEPTTPVFERAKTVHALDRAPTVTGSLVHCHYVIASRPPLSYRNPNSNDSSSGRVKNFLFSTSSRPALGPTQPSIQWGLGALSPWVKRQGREADHSSPVSGEFNKMLIYTSTRLYIFMA